MISLSDEKAKLTGSSKARRRLSANFLVSAGSVSYIPLAIYNWLYYMYGIHIKQIDLHIEQLKLLIACVVRKAYRFCGRMHKHKSSRIS